jgi:hypothetical protein
MLITNLPSNESGIAGVNDDRRDGRKYRIDDGTTKRVTKDKTDQLIWRKRFHSFVWRCVWV